MQVVLHIIVNGLLTSGEVHVILKEASAGDIIKMKQVVWVL